MAKSINPTVLDQALNYLRNNGNKMCLCSAQPTSYAEANATFKLAEQALVPGDYTLANGDVSGRKATVAAKAAVPVTTSGTVNHLAIVDTVNSALLLVTTAPSTAVAAAGTVDVGSFKDEIQAPA